MNDRTLLCSYLLTAVLAAVSSTAAVYAQAAPSGMRSIAFKKYPAVGKILCSPARNATVSREQMETLFLSKSCTDESVPRIDWEAESAVSYYAAGDCDLRAVVDVGLDEVDKIYTITIVRIPGGCNSGGQVSGWLVFEKIREGYTVEFRTAVLEVPGQNEPARDENLTRPTLKRRGTVRPAETVKADVSDCIPLVAGQKMYIRTKAQLEMAVRNDISRGRCLESLKNVDFQQNSLLGISIDSGYCGAPDGLEYQTRARFHESSIISFDVKISYPDSGEMICPVRVPYQFWLLGPKLEDTTKVGIRISAEPSPQEH